MKVENTLNKELINTNTQPKSVSRAEQGESPAAGAGSNAFKVDISDTVRQMIKTLPEEDEVRRDRVAAIRDQLASGSYNISGRDVASKILNALKNGG
ncbi:MAG TPA: flagellar biosynthesis anti-sigma factor FlgM [Deltaproteobacteria bacterium]|nr:flagellar biosynthesis anti-sigma factor FlgM [Deltaproteobacteria bacterium]HQB39341.1 flagellar biosynthesis anti-sigma factor FlgM [Deltaproteobacteria bacterium]